MKKPRCALRRSGYWSRVEAALTLLPMLRVGMHFVTLRVTAICDGSDACSRLESPFRPSATYFDGAKVGNPSANPATGSSATMRAVIRCASRLKQRDA
ncbi:hypothetical protein E2N89_21095 [Pseudomonas syringae pv. tomato]|nr:hypothetical protein E2N89_21095 [Pseudomonas syringae pv. tomato]